MADAPKAIRITRGYAVDQKGADVLKTAGIKTIYRADKGEVPGKFRLRTGETLGVPNGLRTFGEKRADIAATVKLVHSWGASIVDVTTGENSRDDGVEMLHKALMPVSMLTPEQAAAMQKLSAEKRTAGRMGPAAAERAWHNPQIATPELFRELTGWAPSTAHARWGGRWATLRRPRKPK